MQTYLCLSSEFDGQMTDIIISNLFYFSFTPTLITCVYVSQVFKE